MEDTNVTSIQSLDNPAPVGTDLILVFLLGSE